jgi:HAD superfamily hydrolase (TIGR01490 family)
VNLAIFDLDHTLLDGDSDYCWGSFLADKGAVEAASYRRENQRYYEEYCAGTLDIYKFLEFVLKPLTEHPLPQLLAWRDEFMKTQIEPLIRRKAEELIDWHRKRGDELLIITATNSFVTGPIAARLKIPNLLATDPETVNNRFTGKVAGTPCFREGKVERYRQWLQQNGKSPRQTWFYSDSHNDVPLLELVMHPVAVDADEKLTAYAQKKGWRHISLRNHAEPAMEEVLIK